jgi:hypothetical protein
MMAPLKIWFSLILASSNNINKLQRVQNTAARLVLHKRYTHDSLPKLHQLPVGS